jgi:hypothetical protein
VLLPLFGADGRVVSLRARALAPLATNDKSAAPAGFAVAGLVLADGLAQRMLAGDRDALELVRAVGLVVTEGDGDFLVWATRFSDASADAAPAVLGIGAGAWTEEIAAKVPSEARLALRTHLDEAGERYADAVIASLHTRCDVRRLRRSGHVLA